MSICKHKSNDGLCLLQSEPLYTEPCHDGPCTDYQPLTNADRIRAMTDEELYEFICDKSTCYRCGYASTSGCGLLDWLKQEADDELV